MAENRLNFSTLLQVAARSLFLEASWNNQGQQNLGFAAAVDPALKKIYCDPDDLKEARCRTLEYFNTNPITGGVAIGVILWLEEEVAKGRLSSAERQRRGATISRTLASIGDALIWQAWLPLCCLMAVWGTLALDTWLGVLVLPIMFCLVAVPVRLGGLFLGYQRGEGIAGLLVRLKWSQMAIRLKTLLALILGASTVILVAINPLKPLTGLPLGQMWLIVGAVLGLIIVMRRLAGRMRILQHFYPFVVVVLASLFLVISGCG